jgi:hypothetical protein
MPDTIFINLCLARQVSGITRINRPITKLQWPARRNGGSMKGRIWNYTGQHRLWAKHKKTGRIGDMPETKLRKLWEIRQVRWTVMTDELSMAKFSSPEPRKWRINKAANIKLASKRGGLSKREGNRAFGDMPETILTNSWEESQARWTPTTISPRILKFGRSEAHELIINKAGISN